VNGKLKEEIFPNSICIHQICEILNHTLTLKIMKDKLSEGHLSALSNIQVKGLTKFLFSQETT